MSTYKYYTCKHKVIKLDYHLVLTFWFWPAWFVARDPGSFFYMCVCVCVGGGGGGKGKLWVITEAMG